MKIIEQKTNTLILAFGHGGLVCYSYGVPVLVCVVGPQGVRVFATDRKFSKTTSKHLNNWKRIYAMVAPVQVIPHDQLLTQEWVASHGGEA